MQIPPQITLEERLKLITLPNLRHVLWSFRDLQIIMAHSVLTPDYNFTIPKKTKRIPSLIKFLVTFLFLIAVIIFRGEWSDNAAYKLTK